MLQWVVGFLLLSIAVINEANMMGKRLRPAEEANSKPIEDKWFEQPLDHFNTNNAKKWKQRYHVLDEYYKAGGPAFLVMDGEWESTGQDIRDLQVSSIAQQLNGIVLQLEHRFYGQSKPTSDLSIANLKFLSVEQALADAISFLQGMASQYKMPKGTKWIASGGSYAANLAAWIRLKHPDLVYGSVAYSAPLLAKLNFFEYKDVVSNSLKDVNKDCPKAVTEAHIQTRDFMKKQGNNLEDFKKKFQLCDPLDTSNSKNIDCALEVLSDDFGQIVQFNNQITMTIQKACDIMTNSTIKSPIDRYALVSTSVLKDLGKECVDSSYSKKMNILKDVSWNSGKAEDRCWLYQTCTEFGYFQTSYQQQQLFSEDIKLDYFTQQCTDVFGDQFNNKVIERGVAQTNKVYEGQDIKATRVIYVNGKQDPWSRLGITKTKIESSPAIFVNGESHTVCLYTPRQSSPNEVKAACDNVANIVIQWCKE